MADRQVYFDYTPRPWQGEALAGLESHSRSVLVAHRRAGKTELLAIHLLLSAMTIQREHPAPLYGYLAPFLYQAESVVWTRLKYYARNLISAGLARAYEGDLILRLWNGAAIRLFGADHPDRLRGNGFDGVVMDEVAQMKPDTWPAVVLPALSDNQGWAVFIGTPKGQNTFYDLYRDHLHAPDWFIGAYPADRTGVFTDDILDDLRQEMGANLFRQEYLCDFSADNPDSFIEFQAVYDAERREKPFFNQAPLVIGVDVAAQGDDRSCLVLRQGAVLDRLEVWREPDTMRTVGLVAEAIDRYKPRAVFMDDVGLGLGPTHRLKQLGYQVTGVNSGREAARSEKFANLKAEMWWRMNDWLQTACIPDDNALRKDLLAPRREYDARNRLKVESKKDLKQRVHFSTDLADALALTFAQPVASRDVRARRPKNYLEAEA
jgi:hypothetical protein